MTSDLAAWYDAHLPDAQQRLADVEEELRTTLAGADADVVFVAGRVKERASFLEKADRKGYEDPPTQIQDFVATRIVVRRRHKVSPAHAAVHELAEARGWDVLTDEERGEEGHNAAVPGYRAVHMVLGTDPGDPHATVEIQIMTILQHAWAALQHDLVYKGSAEPGHSRRATALAGLLELAEKEFDELRLSMSGGLEQLPEELQTPFDVEVLVKAVCDLPADETTKDRTNEWASALLQVLQELSLSRRADLLDALGPPSERDELVARIRSWRPWLNGHLVVDQLLRLRVPGYVDRRAGGRDVEDDRRAFEAELAALRGPAT